MKGIFQSNSRIYCLTNIFACVLCTGYLYTGYCSVNNNIQHEKIVQINETDTEPLSEKVKKEETNKKTTAKTVVTTAKSNTSSKKYVKPSYDKVTGSAVVSYAKNYLGLRYVSGGNSLTTGTDCSGFTKLIFKEFGITLPRTVKSQAKVGSYVKKSDLQKGDLIFYGYKSGVVSHVAIYIGNGQVIHQSTPKNGVKINTMNMMVYITARRVISKPATTFPEDTNGDIADNSSTNNNVNDNTNINDNINVENNVTNESNNNNITNENNSTSENTNANDNNNNTDNNQNNENNQNNNYTNGEYGN